MDERLAWLRLSLVPGLGPRSTQALLSAIGPPRAILAASPSRLAAVVGARLSQSVLAFNTDVAVEGSLRWLEGPDRHLITLADPTYPDHLANIADPPVVLYAEGQPGLLNRPRLAIVGSRTPTPQGEANAEAFARHLSAQGLTIVSGLALGIDAAAHRGALAGPASTIAVMATGPDRVYPHQHSALAERIRHEGLLLTEAPPGTPASRGLFVRRNRLISGLSLGVLVVEAATASGSLITARQAADQGREVFAMPGSIHSPLSKGCHALIREGAKLVDEAQHILEELGLPHTPAGPAGAHAGTLAGMSAPGSGGTTAGLPGPAIALLEHLGFEPVTPDRLCMASGLTPDVVSAMLTVLELHGEVGAMPGNAFQRIVRPPGAHSP